MIQTAEKLGRTRAKIFETLGAKRAYPNRILVIKDYLRQMKVVEGIAEIHGKEASDLAQEILEDLEKREEELRATEAKRPKKKKKSVVTKKKPEKEACDIECKIDDLDCSEEQIWCMIDDLDI